MLEDEDDPLSRSFFDVGNGASSSLFGNGPTTSAHPASASFFAAHYEEDPWSSIGPYDTTVDTTAAAAAAASGPLSMPDIPTGSTGVTTTGRTTAYEPFPVQTAIETTTVANALGGVKLPEVYNTCFTQHQQSGRVPISALYRILERANISAMDIEMITRTVVPGGATYVTRPEFNAALGLLACAQNHMEISLDSLYQNRFYLPEPRVPSKEHSQVRNYNPLEAKSPDTHKSSEPTSPKVNSVDGYHHRHHHRGGGGRADAATATTAAAVMDSSKVTETKPTRTLNTQNWFQKIEEIKVTIAPEREGFIFKHVNYIVESQKRSSIVLRRYSDFWWLMEVLSRRYPFRMLPNIPPKKVTGRDSAFLEKRRKGLSRFINAIVRHPTLRNDDVVIKFLTEPAELAGWRKQHPPSLEEEYRRKQRNIDEIQSMIPSNLDEQLRKTRHRVTASIEQYINLCFIMERMIRRMRGQATDFVRYSISLNALAETEHRYHAGECQECQQVVKGYETVAKHMQKESSILENQVNVAADGVLENLKRFRDLLVSYRELDERKDKLAANQIESLSKRISTNRTKVNQHKGVPGMEAEVARLEETIRTDEATCHDQQCRQIFIQFCMWSEIIYLHKQQAFVSSLYRSYVRDMIQFSQHRSQNWQELQPPVLEMPVEPELFS